MTIGENIMRLEKEIIDSLREHLRDFIAILLVTNDFFFATDRIYNHLNLKIYKNTK